MLYAMTFRLIHRPLECIYGSNYQSHLFEVDSAIEMRLVVLGLVRDMLRLRYPLAGDGESLPFTLLRHVYGFYTAAKRWP